MGAQEILNSKNRGSRNLKLKVFKYVCIPFMILCTIISTFTDIQFFSWVSCAFQVFLLWIAADFITGVIHWWEDTYGNPNWPIVGKYVVEPNLVHHKHPAKLLEGSYWNRINTSFIPAAILGIMLWGINLIINLYFVFGCAGLSNILRNTSGFTNSESGIEIAIPSI